MDRGRTLRSLATCLAALLTVALSVYAQAHGRLGFWDLLLAAPWPYLAYKLLSSAVRTETASSEREQESPSTNNTPTAMTDAYRAATEALASAIGAKDSYVHPHSDRVPRICGLIGNKMQLDAETIERICLAAMVRDVGKLGIPDYILLKPGPLDTEEFAKMQNHALIGTELLEQARLPNDIVSMVRYHHEKYDGTGYPEGLSGDTIPLGSRILAVAGVYDALVSDRCYRNGWSHSEATEHICRLSGSAFDPEVVDTFLSVEQEIMEMLEEDRKRAADARDDSTCAAIDEIAQANREWMSLFDITQTLSSTLEIDEVLALLASRMRRLLQASTCAVFAIDEDHPKSLIANAVAGRYEDSLKGARARSGRGMTGKAALNKEPRSGNYDPNDLMLSCDAESEMEFRSCAVAPIVSYGELLGTINIYDVSARAFSADEVRVLTFVAHQAALAIQNAKAFEEVRDSALRDPLTNLRNGRFLRHCLERELSRCSRLGEPLSVLGIDLDNFKGVNDLLGHEAGDNALREVADILRRELRDYDIIVRNGGDEFVVVLPGTPASEAGVTAERIRMAVAQYAEQHLAKVPGFGASVGVASYPDGAGDTKSLLSRADASMYRDKRARKQRRKAA